MKSKMSGLGNFGAGEEGGMCEACPELFIPSASSCQSSLFSMDLSFSRFLLIFRHVLWFPIEKCFFLIVYSRKVMCKKGSFFLSYFCYYFFHPKLESNFFYLKTKKQKRLSSWHRFHQQCCLFFHFGFLLFYNQCYIRKTKICLHSGLITWSRITVRLKNFESIFSQKIFLKKIFLEFLVKNSSKYKSDRTKNQL